jgi:hypothetical protein
MAYHPLAYGKAKGTNKSTEEILPYLETNWHRPRVHAIKKADISLRRALLGRALQTKYVRNDSNRLWMFVSGNVDVLVRSIE